jgi:hypothetical protein
MKEAALLEQRAAGMKNADLQQRFTAALAKAPSVASGPGSAVNDEASKAPPAAVNALIMSQPAAANAPPALAAQVSRRCYVAWRCLCTKKPASINLMISSNKQRGQTGRSHIMYGFTHVNFACMLLLTGCTTAFDMIAVQSW